MAASFKLVAAFSNVQQHGEISIIDFTFILILFPPCLFWSCFYLVFSVLRFSSIYCLHVNMSIFIVWETAQDVRSEYNCLVKSFWEISTYEIILGKFQTFSFQAFAFEEVLPGILIPNSQTRHFTWFVIQKTLDF